jgi:hypothetical protein
VQTRVFNYFLKRANEGDMNSQFIIGSRYENGTGVAQDKDKAFEWYEKSAAQGHPIAQQKMENRVGNIANAAKAKEEAEQQAKDAKAHEQAAKAREQAAQAAKAREQAAQAAKAAAASAAAATKAVVAKPPEPVVVAKAAAPKEPAEKSSAEKSINAKDILLKGQWRYNQKPAEYLPSAKTTCLESGDNEIVCFSEELNRTVANSYLTYTVKSTLTNFGSDGAFNVTYLFNVTNIDKAKEPAPAAGKDGPSDLNESLGWQEPGRSVSCKANDEKSLTCMKDRKYALQFTN